MNNLDDIKIGVIGYGHRSKHIAKLLRQMGPVRVVSICDTCVAKAKRDADELEPNGNEINFFDTPDKLLEFSRLDGVVIGTNCSTHTPIAIKVLERKLPLFLEKPVAINDDQLIQLEHAGKKYDMDSKVVVSFPLRLTPLVQKAKEIIDQGTIGTVEHVQAVNNASYGKVYFQGWYRDNNKTGGLFLQKATHDFDYINYLIGHRPMKISAVISKRVFHGKHRFGLYCRDCDENKTCLQSPYNLDCDKVETWLKPEQHMCAFAPDATNEDSGSALIVYDSGMHAVYSQNFFIKHKAGRRGARLMGQKGTVELNWSTDELILYSHIRNTKKIITVDTKGDSHSGGDSELAENFITVIRGECESKSTLNSGILSAQMCIRAKESAKTHSFQNIETKYE